jgi:hypothetical protein
LTILSFAFCYQIKEYDKEKMAATVKINKNLGRLAVKTSKLDPAKYADYSPGYLARTESA